jgi:hypothetical protein
MRCGVVASELLTEDTVLRRVQRPMSYKFRARLDVNEEVNGNPVRVKFWLLTTNHQEWRIFGGGFRSPSCFGAD